MRDVLTFCKDICNVVGFILIVVLAIVVFVKSSRLFKAVEEYLKEKDSLSAEEKAEKWKSFRKKLFWDIIRVLAGIVIIFGIVFLLMVFSGQL